MALKQNIDSIANQAVEAYIENETPLQNTVDDLIKAGHLEKHKSRVVEATNKAAFLKLYPKGIHQFELAKSAQTVNDKTFNYVDNNNTESLVKAASIAAGISNSDINMSDTQPNYNLIGMFPDLMKAEIVKNGSVRPAQLLRGKIKLASKTISNSISEAKEKICNSRNLLISTTKQAMIRGASYQDIETYALSSLPRPLLKEGQALMDHIHDAVSASKVINKTACARGHYSEKMAIASNQYSDIIKDIIKYSACIPSLHQAQAILDKKITILSDAIAGGTAQ